MSLVVYLAGRRPLLYFLVGSFVIYFFFMVRLHKEIGTASLMRHEESPKDSYIGKRHKLKGSASPDDFAKLDFIARRSHVAGFNVISKRNRPLLFRAWKEDAAGLCDDNVVAYAGEFAHLRNVVVIPPGDCPPPKDATSLKPPPCFHSLLCSTALKPYKFNDSSHLNSWLSAVNTAPAGAAGLSPNIPDPHLNIVVVRHPEVNNPYYVMADLYNSFLMMTFFNRSQADTAVLVADEHPPGEFESLWTALFNSADGLYTHSENRLYDDLVWSIASKRSPLTQHYAVSEYLIDEMGLVFNSVRFVPLLKLFRQFLLDTFRYDYKKKLDCNHLSIVYIRNSRPAGEDTSGSSFKYCTVANEEELLDLMRTEYPEHKVKVLSTGAVSIRKQLGIVAEADILVGIHSPWLVYTLLLPHHGGLVEFVPSHLNTWDAVHFQALTTWRQLAYGRWDNWNPKNELPGYVTHVPLEALGEQLDEVIREMCKGEKPDL